MNEEPAFYDPPADHKNRRTHILIGGILLGLTGLLALAGGGIYAAMPLIMENLIGTAGGSSFLDFELEGGLNLKTFMLAFGITIIALAGFLCAAALGSLMMRRWCRVLALTLLWGWIYNGVTSIVSYLTTYPAMMRAMMTASGEDGEMADMDSMIGVQVVMNVGANLVFSIALPGLLIWFYWGRHAVNTLKLADRKERWTDPCPAPVLGMVWTALMCVPYMLAAALAMPIPWVVAGHPISGGAMQIAYAMLAVFWGYIAWGAYRRQAASWVLAAVLVAGGLYLGFDFCMNFQPFAYLETLQLPEEWTAGLMESRSTIEPQVDALRRPMLVLTLVSVIPFFGYLGWVARYFFGSKQEPAATAS